MRVELTRANAHYPLKVARLPFRHLDILGAKNGTRTRDLNLGKVALYQLSYSRTKSRFSSPQKLLEARSGIEPL